MSKQRQHVNGPTRGMWDRVGMPRLSARQVILVVLTGAAGFIIALGLSPRLVGAASPVLAEPLSTKCVDGGEVFSCSCGDGYCQETCTSSCPCCETASNCPQDCGSGCTTVCGDGVCAWDDCEGTWNCELDCVWCGDGMCAARERSASSADYCPADCGEDTSGGQATEEPTQEATAEATAEATEEPTKEPGGGCPPFVCGDGVCAGAGCEGTWNCPQDCVFCGDTVCGTGEADASSSKYCPGDCKDVIDAGQDDGEEAKDDDAAQKDEDAAAKKNDDAAKEDETNAKKDEDVTGFSTEDEESGEDKSGGAGSTGEVNKGCRLVGLDEMPFGITDAFAGQMNGYLAPTWLICDDPPGKVVLPSDAKLDTGKTIRLLDCDSSGKCASYDATLVETDTFTYEAALGRGQPVCDEGCAFGGEQAVPTQVVTRLLPYLIPAVALVAIGLIIILVLLFRSPRRREDPKEG
jgi:hypothetical protein